MVRDTEAVNGLKCHVGVEFSVYRRTVSGSGSRDKQHG